MTGFFFMLNAAMAALNAALYADSGHALNLGAAVFSGLVALFMLALLVSE